MKIRSMSYCIVWSGIVPCRIIWLVRSFARSSVCSFVCLEVRSMHVRARDCTVPPYLRTKLGSTSMYDKQFSLLHFVCCLLVLVVHNADPF